MQEMSPRNRPTLVRFTALLVLLGALLARKTWSLWQQERGNTLVAAFAVSRGSDESDSQLWYLNDHRLLLYHARSISLWDNRSQKLVPSITAAVQGAAPSGRYLYVTSDLDKQTHADHGAVWNALTRQKLCSLQSEVDDWWYLSNPAFSHDGTVVACTQEGRRKPNQVRETYSPHITITAWSTATGRQLWSVDEPAMDQIADLQKFPVAFSPDDTLLVEATANGMFPVQSDIRLRDAHTGRLIKVLARDEDAEQYTTANSLGWNTIAFSLDGSKVVACGGDLSSYSNNGHDGAIYVWDARDGHLIWKGAKPNSQAKVLAFSSDGKWVAAGCTTLDRADSFVGGEVTLWDLTTGQLLRTLSRETTLDTLIYFSQVVEKQSRRLFSKQREGRVDADTSFPVGSLAFSPDNTHLAGYDNAGVISIWRLM